MDSECDTVWCRLLQMIHLSSSGKQSGVELFLQSKKKMKMQSTVQLSDTTFCAELC